MLQHSSSIWMRLSTKYIVSYGATKNDWKLLREIFGGCNICRRLAEPTTNQRPRSADGTFDATGGHRHNDEQLSTESGYSFRVQKSTRQFQHGNFQKFLLPYFLYFLITSPDSSKIEVWKVSTESSIKCENNLKWNINVSKKAAFLIVSNCTLF